MGRLTTHVLDTMNGWAAGMAVSLYCPLPCAASS